MNRLAAVALALAAAVHLSGCGGGGSGRHAVRSTTTHPAGDTSSAGSANNVSTTTRAGGGVRGKSTDTTRVGGSSTTTSTLPTTVKGAAPALLSARMGADCVKRTQTQSITVKSTPGFQVAIATQWPDGGGHIEWNGWAVGVIPPNGKFVKAWPIPGAAPYGAARTDVTVTNGDGSQIALAHPTWKIAASCR